MPSCFQCKNYDEDESEMLRCSGCNKRWHFQCAGVNGTTDCITWTCVKCNGSIATTTSAAAPLAQSDPEVAASRNLPGAPSSDINRQKFASYIVSTAPPEKVQSGTTWSTAYEPEGPLEELGTVGSHTHTSTIDNIYSGMRALPTSTWVQTSDVTIPKTSATMYTNIRNDVNTTQHSPYKNIARQQSMPSNVRSAVNDIESIKQCELKLAMLEEERKIQQSFLERKYEILSSHNISKTPVHNSKQFAPTSAQLAARQAIPKELPHFHGDPEDWPLFISSFETSTEIAGYSHIENLMRLQASLKGKAKEMVKAKLTIPSMVPEILQTLRMCFGRPEFILENAIEKIRKIPPLKDRLDSLIDYALCVRNVYSTMDSCHLDAYMDNPMLVKELVEKLPNKYKLDWAMHQKGETEPAIKVFSDWLYTLAEAASQVVSPMTIKRSGVINTHVRQGDVQGQHVCQHCKAMGHKIVSCNEFQKLSVDHRWEIVRALKICRQCLNFHRRRCNASKPCGIEGCNAKHHQLLHQTRAPASAKVSVNSHHNRDNNVLFRILPVRIFSNKSYLDTFAFLDEGSSVTLIEKEIYDYLDLKGVHDPLCLRWTGNKIRNEEESMRANLGIANVKGGEHFTMKGVHTVSTLGLPMQSLDMNQLIQQHSYLAGLPIQSYVNARPTILIGSDNWRLAVPLKIHEGAWYEPIATKTRLGWAIQGRCSGTLVNSQVNVHTCECHKKYEELHDLVRENFKLESPPPSLMMSQEDEKSLQILESTCRKVEDRYEVGLLWRQDDVNLPDSYLMAHKRLMCLNKKFSKDASLKSVMQKQIENLVQKGYARKLSSEELQMTEGRIWYLPIFIAKNPNKPGKLRLVWDAAAKTNGLSLNDFISCGPDLLTPLVDILLGFRIGRFAICGDIAEMFHQIIIREDDMHVQRFLWCDEDNAIDQPSVYVMRAMTFGISCAPCIAHYVRNRNADTFVQQHPRAVEAIKEHHYVDDFIDSADSEQAALELAVTVKHIHASAGFNIRNWSSNSTLVLSQLSEHRDRSQNPVQLGADEKVLGIYWDPNKDVFKYAFRFVRLKRDVFTYNITPTKRELLQVLMSIFDPLGFLSYFTITLKILLQEVWRSTTDWDEEIPEDLIDRWRHWRDNLAQINSVEIPRCYSPALNNADDVQLHTFVDAGEYGYAAVSYLRVQSGSEIKISIVAAKSKVTPLKPISIPRLELQAAITGVRLASRIQSIPRLRVQRKLFWTDSATVLKWLRIDPRRFQQFVMFRVAEILENSNLEQWKWLPSKLNPADLATKSVPKTRPELWLSGPTFLLAEECEWPRRDDFGPINTTEIRHHMLHVIEAKQRKLAINTEYFSSWRRLYRALATFLLYIEKLKSKVKSVNLPENITFEMVQAAKLTLIRQAQLNDYFNEIVNITNGKNLEKDSNLISLNVYIDELKIMRVKGRADFLSPQDPIVLPSKQNVTYLIVKDVHERYHHLSHETVLNDIKGKFYIPRLRILYRKVRNACQYCKNKKAAPQPPQMAALPVARLACYERPFSYVGIDYFGPMFVVVGRRREKRWGVIFTCLTIRAVHIEVAHSLDINSCVLCFRNFISRRGTPREVYTDNGTNFRATEKVLREEISNVDHATIEAKYIDIKWKFNPPAAPHMGGAWERLIRSIKAVLYAMHPEPTFNDETLRSALLEVEFIINSRPLTFVSMESGDDEAITPNHLLIGSSSGYKPLGISGDLRQRYKQTQLYADRFWQRWVKEYRPMLTRRSKWFTKQPPLKVGDVVIIVDESQPRNCWPKGIVTNTITAKDGQVRRATVRTQFGLLERPAMKIAVLDVGNTRE